MSGACLSKRVGAGLYVAPLCPFCPPRGFAVSLLPLPFCCGFPCCDFTFWPMAFFDDGVWALSCCASLRSNSEIFFNAFASLRSNSGIFFNSFAGLRSSSAILSNAMPKLSCRISNCCLSSRYSALVFLYSFLSSVLVANDEHAIY